MNDFRLLPDDPRLTAYALGELSGAERAAVEAALHENPALRLVVDEIRATAEQIESALAGEPAAAAPSTAHLLNGVVVKINGHAGRTHEGSRSRVSGQVTTDDRTDAYARPHGRKKLIHFPQSYYLIAMAAAACFAILVARYDAPAPRAREEQTVRRTIVLAPATAPAESGATVADAGEAIDPAGAAAVALTGPDVVSTDTAMPAVVTTAGAASAGPAFVDGSLSLLGQARQSQDEARQTAVVRSASRAVQLPLDLSPAGTSMGGTFAGSRSTEGGREDARPVEGIVAGTVAVRGASAATAGSPTAPVVFFDAVKPPTSGPVVASATPPSLVPDASGRSTPSSTAGNDVVVLSAFTVSADRAVGFAAASSAKVATDRRANNNRENLPPPPPGAKFGRNTEAYSFIRDNDFLSAVDHPLSTFALDVDTASYANVRRILQHGSPPPRDAVRIEELLNYFPYRYTPPRDDLPFAVSLEVAQTPWAPDHRLVRIGLKAREVTRAQRPAANLVFLLDVSGSMNAPNKLPLVKQSLRLLVGRLRPDDRVAIVTYAGNSGLALPSTPASQSREILNALDALTPGGSTNGAMGIQLAYEIAKANFVSSGINRVILCTDGDFNVGVTSEGELVRLIEEKTGSGVFLTVLGFGMGNYKDATLEKLANKGNGNYGYIDTQREAEKLLVEQINGTLVTVAKDVKLQVEFNPATVASYRLIGYENRLLRKEDFNNDQVDAGELGAGHTVTALYEIVPASLERSRRPEISAVDELKYAARGAVSSRLEMPGRQRDALSNELLTVKVRFKKPDSLFSFAKTLEFPLVDAVMPFAKASSDFRFAAAVAEFGMILRGSPHRGNATMGDVAAWAAAAAATPEDDPGGYRGEFLELVRRAQTMME